MGKVIGIDYGMARVGLAVSDDSSIMAFPLKCIGALKDHKKTAEAIIKETEASNVDSFVIGLPLLMSGKDSDMTREVRTFTKTLEEVSGKKVALWDERLTSKEIEKLLIEGDMKRKKRSKFIDTLSATLILQSYLDSQKQLQI
ncbi:MAG: putative pre-16S rRNA nuclease [Chlamydiia bacterium]|nr:putative pre-16S rRNA nuclease [Chlamydiia bacterium]